MNRREHEKFSKEIIGCKCSNTHKWIDYPVKFMGRKHRKLFHDPITATIIGCIVDKNCLCGITHLLADMNLQGIVKFLKAIGKKNKNEKVFNW